MKFPLQRAPFAPLQLSAADHEAMADLADVFVNETLADYESHLEDDHGVVNEARWKLFKKFDNVTVFQDREGLQSRRMSRDDMGESETPKDLQRLLWFGTVAGDLDDLMFGVINPTAAEARIKSAYVGNNVLDFAVLDTIVEATPEDPFRGLQVKWAVNGGPTMMRAMVRPRDFVYLESTGMTRTTKGERIGYHILHSIEIPGVPELHEHKIVRGSMTLYHLYRQKSDGVVETYVKAFIDLLGDMPAAVGAMVSAKGVVSVWKLAECSQLKKLSWMLSKRRPVEPSPNSDICNVCTRSMSAIVGRTKTCKACKARVCSKCCVSKKMCYFSQLTREVLQQNVTFCIQCVRTATRTNGLEVALDEMHARRKRKQSTLQWYTTGMVSPTSSSASMSW